MEGGLLVVWFVNYLQNAPYFSTALGVPLTYRQDPTFLAWPNGMVRA
jgi:hypothetical protein